LTKAYRPSDYKSKRKCEEDCTEGLDETYHLTTPDKIIKYANAMLLVDWMDQLQLFMEDTGQDGVFHLTHKEKEVNLLKDFGQMNIEETKAAVGVTKALNCPYDTNNFKTSGTAVRASLATTMLHRIKGMVPVDASGPETLAAVIQAHQVLDSSGCRVLIEGLSKMRLQNFPAENVDEFQLKGARFCRNLQRRTRCCSIAVNGRQPPTKKKTFLNRFKQCFLRWNKNLIQN
jgi:hypothetical protein